MTRHCDNCEQKASECPALQERVGMDHLLFREGETRQYLCNAVKLRQEEIQREISQLD